MTSDFLTMDSEHKDTVLFEEQRLTNSPAGKQHLDEKRNRIVAKIQQRTRKKSSMESMVY